MTVRIGITGPTGCGKSTAAGWLRELGAVVVDADQVARAVVEPGEPALEAVFAAFGDEVRAPDGHLDRAALGRIVFADPAGLTRLESIVHPAVRPRIRAAMAEADAASAPAVVIEAIKLFEGGLADECDESWLFECSSAEQWARLVARGVPQAAAAARIAAQGAMVDRLRSRASRVIDTSGSIEGARARVTAAYEAALAAPRADGPRGA